MVYIHKSFIFDMDGVLIDGEPMWEQEKVKIISELLGAKNTQALGNTSGLSIDKIYERAVERGYSIDRQRVHELFLAHGESIYENAPLTPGLEEFISWITDKGYKVGLVSASPIHWIDIVLRRAKIDRYFDSVVSLHLHDSLRHKPHPDGYSYTISYLGSMPDNSFILEDSNSGIASAKAAGASVIGFRANLLPNYNQTGADYYADSFDEVKSILEHNS